MSERGAVNRLKCHIGSINNRIKIYESKLSPAVDGAEFPYIVH